jgi:hypothetical protein
MTTIIKVTDQSTRAELEQAIAALRVKQDRMPSAWVERRAEVAEEIDSLVDWWLEAKAEGLLRTGCHRLQPESRCAEHRRERERARGTRQARGYDTAHDRLRADYQRRMDRGLSFYCWRCQTRGVRTLIDPSNWTLGHCDDDRSKYHGPECPPCDYAVAGRTGCPHPTHSIPQKV